MAFGGLVPEEELALCQFFFLCLGGEDGLEGVGMEAGVPSLGGDGHGRGGEVLHLLELEVEVFGQTGELGHVFGGAAGMGADEVGDDLLAQVVAAVDVVEDALEVVEELEGGLAHEGEHAVGGVFGRHFQTAADVAGDELLGVLAVDAVGALVAGVVHEEVVAHAGADEALLDAGHSVDGSVDVEQGGVVGVEIGADLGMDARGALALVAEVEVLAVHGVHVGRWAAEVLR